MVPVIFGRAGQDSAVRFPRVNVVSIAILLASLAIGLLGANAFDTPIPLVIMAIVGAVLMIAIPCVWDKSCRAALGRPPLQKNAAILPSFSASADSLTPS
jgi:hypothetical protein